MYFIILCLLGFLCMAYILSPFCSFQTSSPALCGPTSPMYRTLTYAVWLTSYLMLSLVLERIIPRSPISTALRDGALGPPSFPRLLCYRLLPPMLPCFCLVFFKRPLLHPRFSQPCTASVRRTMLLVYSLLLVTHSHRLGLRVGQAEAVPPDVQKIAYDKGDFVQVFPKP